MRFEVPHLQRPRPFRVNFYITTITSLRPVRSPYRPITRITKIFISQREITVHDFSSSVTCPKIRVTGGCLALEAGFKSHKSPIQSIFLSMTLWFGALLRLLCPPVERKDRHLTPGLTLRIIHVHK